MVCGIHDRGEESGPMGDSHNSELNQASLTVTIERGSAWEPQYRYQGVAV
jgi:hypothetical protein